MNGLSRQYRRRRNQRRDRRPHLGYTSFRCFCGEPRRVEYLFCDICFGSLPEGMRGAVMGAGHRPKAERETIARIATEYLRARAEEAA